MSISKAALAIITENTREANRLRIQYLSAVIHGVREEVLDTIDSETYTDDAEQLTQELISSAINAVLELSDVEIGQAIQTAEEEAHLQRLAKLDEKEDPEKKGDSVIQRLRLQRGYR